MDLMNVPPALRLKAQKIAQDKIADARRRAVTRMQRMTPKKAAKLSEEQLANAQERARRRLAWQKQVADAPQGSPGFDKPEQPGEWEAYYADRIPDYRARFTPRKGLQDAWIDEKTEGLQQELIERYGVPPESAGDIASNAVDKWAKLVTPPEPQDGPTPYIPIELRPQFKIHPFSPVNYQQGDSMAMTFEGYDDGGQAYMGETSVAERPVVGSAAGEDTPPVALPETDETHLPVTSKAVLADVKQQNAGKGIIPLALLGGVLVYVAFRKKR